MENSTEIRYEEYKKIVTELDSDPNLHFIIQEKDLEMAIKNPKPDIVEMVLKKAALYGAKAIILLKEPGRETYFSSGHHIDRIDKGVELIAHRDSHVSESLRSLYSQFNKNSSFHKIFYFLPEQIETEIAGYKDYEHCMPTQYSVTSFLSIYTNKFGIDMTLSDPTINFHIFETLQCKNNELSVLNVWLPQLANVPLDILLKLREDEYDSFTKFQFALKRLIVDSGEINSETKLKELFQYVDYEVRSFETKMNQIKKSRLLKTYEAVINFSIMGLCFAIPSDVAKLITTYFGLSQGKELISLIFRERERMYELKASDFYVPWLCAKKKHKR